MKTIELNKQGKNKGKRVALVDDADYEYLNQWRWHAIPDHHTKNTFYVMRSDNVPMHRLLTQPTKGMVIDHIDGNGLNNQRSNLRICTHQQNTMNSMKRKGQSKYKGVSVIKKKYIKDNKFHKKGDDDIGYVVRVRINGISTYLGYFKDEIKAALAYDSAARKQYGQFAKLNFPEKT